MGYRSFDTAQRTLSGIEVVNMLRKGQVKRVAKGDGLAQARFVANLFQVTA